MKELNCSQMLYKTEGGGDSIEDVRIVTDTA